MNDSEPPLPKLRPQLYALRAASASGAGVSLLLVRQHIDYAIKGALESPLCQVGGWFDCEAIEASGYASFFNIPVASVGLFYFGLLSVLSWTIRPGAGPEGWRRWQGIFGWLTLPALVAVWGLAMLSATVIESFCLGCTLVYCLTLICAASVVLVEPRRYLRSLTESAKLPALAGMSRHFTRPAVRFRVALMVATLLIGAVLNFGVPVWIIQRSAAAPVVAAYLKQPIVELLPPREGLSEGDPEAPLRIIVFTDFACPYCARFESDLSQLLSAREGKYFLGFKHYPLSRECNPIMSRASFDHVNACRLAQMAEALADLGRFEDVRESLYIAGDADLYPILKEIATGAEIKYGDWAARAISPDVKRRVESDIQEGLDLGIRALPAVYVNGRPLPSLDPARVEEILAAAERAAG